MVTASSVAAYFNKQFLWWLENFHKMSKSAKVKRNRFKSASNRAHSEECIWQIEDAPRSVCEPSKSIAVKIKNVIEIFFSLSSRQSESLSAHPRRNRKPLDGKEFVKIVTRDGVRNLLIPKKLPNAYEEFWPERELERLQSKAKVLTVEDKMRELEGKVVENKKLKEESELRKQRLREIDLAKSVKMEDNEDPYKVAEAEQNLKLLDRAYLAKQEQVWVELN